MAINQMFDLHLWDGWLWQKKGSIHWFISTHSPATCWFIAVVYMFLVNILLFGDPRTCIDIALCVFFRVYIHVCCLLVVILPHVCWLVSFSVQHFTGIYIHIDPVSSWWNFGFLGCMAITAYSPLIKHGKFALSTSHLYHGSFLPHSKPPFLGGDFPVSLVWFLLLDPRFHLAKKSPICRRCNVQLCPAAPMTWQGAQRWTISSN